MSSLLFAGASAGLAAGAVMTFLAHVAPRFGAGNFIRDIDQPTFFSRELSRREAHFLGILVHLIFTLFAGGVYALGVDRGLISSFTLLPILGWSFVLFLIVGLVALPLEGHGFFGVKHDAWFPVDLVFACLGWGALFFIFMRLWIP